MVTEISADAIGKLLSAKLIGEMQKAILAASVSVEDVGPPFMPTPAEVADAVYSMLQEIYVTSAGPEWEFSENWIRQPYGLPNRVGHRAYIAKPSVPGAALPRSKCDGGPTGGGFATISAVTPTSMSQFVGC